MLADELRKQRQYQTVFCKREPGPEDFIFGTRTGKPLNVDATRRQVLYRAMDKAGVSRQGRAYGWHIFRHSSGTAHYEATRDIHSTQGFLGHASVKITEGVYMHAKRDVVKDAETVQDHWLRGVFPSVPSDVPLPSKTVQ